MNPCGGEAFLALLDLGRSIFARVGYARPLSIWQPDPQVYADLLFKEILE